LLVLTFDAVHTEQLPDIVEVWPAIVGRWAELGHRLPPPERPTKYPHPKGSSGSSPGISLDRPTELNMTIRDFQLSLKSLQGRIAT
jgi:hypothetical protein